jgi:hypothetical protein
MSTFECFLTKKLANIFSLNILANYLGASRSRD